VYNVSLLDFCDRKIEELKRLPERLNELHGQMPLNPHCHFFFSARFFWWVLECIGEPFNHFLRPTKQKPEEIVTRISHRRRISSENTATLNWTLARQLEVCGPRGTV
jgi:hypothetical protein